MQEEMEKLVREAEALLEKADNESLLSDLRVKLLGKKGQVTALMKQMGSIPPEERPKFGQAVNTARTRIETVLEEKRKALESRLKEEKLAREKVDVTLPSGGEEIGARHPLMQVYEELRGIFGRMGYKVVRGPEIEYDKYNFELLNIPKDHPARDMQDTFYITDEILLRTQTSAVQVRAMLATKPPIRMICPGRVFRTDDVDATHSPVFNQMEGLVVEKGVTMGDLKATIETCLKEFFGSETKTRFRPGYFPFTEPSAEVDATCSLCHGKGCPACKGAGIIEVLGCGMVNPHVLESCGIDPEVYSGFAFGMGMDRLANIKYGITDIRLLYENDVRFIGQFR